MVHSIFELGPRPSSGEVLPDNRDTPLLLPGLAARDDDGSDGDGAEAAILDGYGCNAGPKNAPSGGSVRGCHAFVWAR